MGINKRGLKWHPEASSDLTSITRYCNLKFGRKVAKEVRDKIVKDVELLPAYPKLGSIERLLIGCTSLEYRSLLSGKQTKIIYSIHDDYVYIHLLWDVRQDESRLSGKVVQRYPFSDDMAKNVVNEPIV